MRIRVVPSVTFLRAVGILAGCVLISLIAGLSTEIVGWTTTVLVTLLAMAAVADYGFTRFTWRSAPPVLTRQLPSALAIGVRATVRLTVQSNGPYPWQCAIYDGADSSLITHTLPVSADLSSISRLEADYTITPTRRGEVAFTPADCRVSSRFGLLETLESLGPAQTRRVYPDFAQVARYAWLAGDHRLAEIGIKTYQRRGAGTDFDQLAEYRIGDPVRHIDWKATHRHGKPIIREFQDERDQSVLLLIDCGRRMRAQEGDGIGTAHFDHVLNAVMLLAYVALKQGDAVGAMTFGSGTDRERAFAPRKGVEALNALMGELYAVQPTLAVSDYVAAARALLGRSRKRALVIVITNFRDEDQTELGQALRLLRSRHLVLLASLRERIVRELASQPLAGPDAPLEIASAHLHGQARRDAFNLLAARDALMVDAEPQALAVELVNRYHAVKRAGLI